MHPSVILTCTSYQRGELPNNGTFELGPGGGSIGRNPSCDIVLNDPQKLISRCHAKIVTSGGEVLVVDQSTNGLYINGAQLPLGRGGSAALRDGMQLGLGDFIFLVSIGHAARSEPKIAPHPDKSPNTVFDRSRLDLLAGVTPAPLPSVAEDPLECAAAPSTGTHEALGADGRAVPPPGPHPSTHGMPDPDSQFEEQVLKGLMDLLAARASFKNHLRMGATLVSQTENNPLKFAANVAAAKVLFAEVSQNDAYLTRAEAVAQAMAELQEHQTALLIGMRAAFNQLLETFDPKNFEEKRGAGLGKILSTPNNSAWDAYRKFYRDRVTRSDDPFQDLLSAAFAKAYLADTDKD